MAAQWQAGMGQRTETLALQLEMELAWIDGVLQNDSSKRFAICLEPDERYVGNVQLTDIHDGEAEFHIFIGERQFWGKGIAPQATKLLLGHARDVLRLKRILLHVRPDHGAAIRVYSKCGFLGTPGVSDQMEIRF